MGKAQQEVMLLLASVVTDFTFFFCQGHSYADNYTNSLLFQVSKTDLVMRNIT